MRARVTLRVIAAATAVLVLAPARAALATPPDADPQARVTSANTPSTYFNPDAITFEPDVTEVVAVDAGIVTTYSGPVLLWKVNGITTSVYGQENLGGDAMSSPKHWRGTLNGEQRQVVLVRGTDDAVWWKSRINRWDMGSPAPDGRVRGPWSGWVSLGGGTTERPAFDGRHLVVRGRDGNLWQRLLVGAQWSPWRRVGGYFDLSPDIVAGDTTNDVTVYGVNEIGPPREQIVIARKPVSAVYWGPWQPGPPPLPGNEVITQDTDVEPGPVITIRGYSGTCYSTARTGTDWSPWTACGTGRGSGISRAAHSEWPATWAHLFSYAANGDLQLRLENGTATPTPWITFAHP